MNELSGDVQRTSLLCRARSIQARHRDSYCPSEGTVRNECWRFHQNGMFQLARILRPTRRSGIAGLISWSRSYPNMWVKAQPAIFWEDCIFTIPTRGTYEKIKSQPARNDILCETVRNPMWIHTSSMKKPSSQSTGILGRCCGAMGADLPQTISAPLLLFVPAAYG